MPKSYVFAIGFNKCGTSSLCRALNSLGYWTDHFSTELIVKRAIRENKPPLFYVKRDFDAFTDNSWISEHFELVDKQYPGKFILLTRNLEDWLTSRRNHVLRNREMTKAGTYNGGWLTIDCEAWTAAWNTYLPRVKEHFKNRPDDLLIMDVCNGEGYEKLCPFLNKKVPNKPFPKNNMTKKKGA